jgi:hypothetical protein
MRATQGLPLLLLKAATGQQAVREADGVAMNSLGSEPRCFENLESVGGMTDKT